MAEFIDEFPGRLQVEEPVTIPLEVDDYRVTISGIVDLVHVTNGRVDIVDYKTDSTRRAQSEYRKQVSVYYHVLSEWYPERTVTTSPFYTSDGTCEQIDPLSLEDLRVLIRNRSVEI